MHGLAKEPEVSLEAAIANLATSIQYKDKLSTLGNAINRAKLFAFNFMRKHAGNKMYEGLTENRVASLHLFTQETAFYPTLNVACRGENQSDIQPFMPWIKLALSGLYALPLEKPRTVYRGVKLDLSAQYPKGFRFVNWQFASTSLSIETLRSPMFLGNSGKRTLFAFEARSLVDVCALSAHAAEKELLLLPGTQLVVDSVLDMGHGLTMVQVREDYASKPLLDYIHPGLTPNESTSSSSPSPSQQQQFVDIQVPAGAAGGSQLRVKLGNGQEVSVVVPTGLQPGNTFRIALPGSSGGDSTVIARLQQKGLHNVVRWYNFWKPTGYTAPPSAGKRNLSVLKSRLQWQNRGRDPAGYMKFTNTFFCRGYQGRWYPVVPSERTKQASDAFKAKSGFANMKTLIVTSNQVIYTYDGKYNGASFQAYSEVYYASNGLILQETYNLLPKNGTIPKLGDFRPGQRPASTSQLTERNRQSVLRIAQAINSGDPALRNAVFAQKTIPYCVVFFKHQMTIYTSQAGHHKGWANIKSKGFTLSNIEFLPQDKETPNTVMCIFDYTWEGMARRGIGTFRFTRSGKRFMTMYYRIV